MKRYMLYVALAAIIGCKSLLGVDNPMGLGGCGDTHRAPEPSAVLEWRSADSQAYTSEVTVVGDTGKVRVYGWVDVACTGYSASVERNGQGLALYIDAVSVSGPCITAVIPAYYECTVYDVEPGTYELTVAFTHRNSDETTVVVHDAAFTGPVTVH